MTDMKQLDTESVEHLQDRVIKVLLQVKTAHRANRVLQLYEDHQSMCHVYPTDRVSIALNLALELTKLTAPVPPKD